MPKSLQIIDILKKYPGKKPLYNFVCRQVILPMLGSKSITIQFLLDILDDNCTSIFKFDKSLNTITKKFKASRDEKSKVDCGVIFIRLNRLLAKMGYPTLEEYPEIPDYGF
jgi:hypothetical protein